MLVSTWSVDLPGDLDKSLTMSSNTFRVLPKPAPTDLTLQFKDATR
ncbi:MAG: hypothetical protein ACRCUX_10420 [Beijerinckiaceae bacterium]